MKNPAEKLMTLSQAASWAKQWRAAGKTLAVTNGVFDLMHRGHAEYLASAAAEADGLLIAVNSDASVRALKGPTRPIVPEEDRAWMLASLECVSAVVIFQGERATEVFRQIPADVYVKGGDYTEASLDPEEHAALKAGGARFRFIPLVPGRSTTSLVRQIRGEGEADYSGARKIGPILARRSVRKFQRRPVGDEMLEELLQAAMAAPSARCCDPWRFLVVREKSRLESLAELLPNGAFLREAGACVLLYGNPGDACGGSLSYWLQDCGAAMENLLLAASMMGLGGCWLGIHPREERMEAVRRFFALPEGQILFGAAALGWPADFPAPRSRYQGERITWL